MSGYIPWTVVDKQLHALRSIWLSTTRPDGRPHSVPVWFTWDGRTLYFATHETSQKARNLERRQWVVLHAGDGDDVIILEGVVEVVTDDPDVQRVDKARGEKYVDPPTGARDTILVDGTIVYRLQLRHVMAWMYGDLRGRTDWTFDEQGPFEDDGAATQSR